MGENEAVSVADVAPDLVLMADQLRSLAANGLNFTEDPYQIERFHTVMAIAARLTGLVHPESSGQIEQRFLADLDLKTPLAVVDTAVFDLSGRMLLIQRADNHCWAMPGGACEVGETPALGAAREVLEETGYTVQIDRFLGLFDSTHAGGQASRHLYHILFAGSPGDTPPASPSTANEILDLGWFTPSQIAELTLSPGHSPRIRHALAWQMQPDLPPFFD